MRLSAVLKQLEFPKKLFIRFFRRYQNPEVLGHIDHDRAVTKIQTDLKDSALIYIWPESEKIMTISLDQTYYVVNVLKSNSYSPDELVTNLDDALGFVLDEWNFTVETPNIYVVSGIQETFTRTDKITKRSEEYLKRMARVINRRYKLIDKIFQQVIDSKLKTIDSLIKAERYDVAAKRLRDVHFLKRTQTLLMQVYETQPNSYWREVQNRISELTDHTVSLHTLIDEHGEFDAFLALRSHLMRNTLS